jgi:hypothetical protein
MLERRTTRPPSGESFRFACSRTARRLMPLRLSTERKAFGLTPMMRARSFVLSVASASRISVSSPVVHRLRGRLSDSASAVRDRREMVTVAHEQETTDGAFGFRVCCSEVLHMNHT